MSHSNPSNGISKIVSTVNKMNGLLIILNTILVFLAILAFLVYTPPNLATEVSRDNSEFTIKQENKQGSNPKTYVYKAFIVSIKGKSGEDISEFLNEYSDWELVGFDNELLPEENQAIFIFKKAE